MSEIKGRNEGLIHDNQRLSEDLNSAQARYDASLATSDGLISRKTNEISIAYGKSLSALAEQVKLTLEENQKLRNALSELRGQEKHRAAGRKESALQSLNERF